MSTARPVYTRQSKTTQELKLKYIISWILQIRRTLNNSGGTTLSQYLIYQEYLNRAFNLSYQPWKCQNKIVKKNKCLNWIDYRFFLNDIKFSSTYFIFNNNSCHENKKKYFFCTYQAFWFEVYSKYKKGVKFANHIINSRGIDLNNYFTTFIAFSHQGVKFANHCVKFKGE